MVGAEQLVVDGRVEIERKSDYVRHFMKMN